MLKENTDIKLEWRLISAKTLVGLGKRLDRPRASYSLFN